MPVPTATRPPPPTTTRASTATDCPSTGSGRPHYPGRMADDIREQIAALAATLTSIETVLDLPTMHKELEQLETDAADPDLCNDQEGAQQVTSKMSHLRSDCQRGEASRGRIACRQAGIRPEHTNLSQDAASDIPQLRKESNALEGCTLLSGESDEREALVSINSGTGGTD